MINFDIKGSGIQTEVFACQKLIDKVHDKVWDKVGKGHKMMGWLDWPLSYDANEIKQINAKVKDLNKKGVDTLLVIGIGGSFLGAAAGIDFLLGSVRMRDKILFAGTNVSDSYIKQLEEQLKDKKWGICVISKSGTTLEPAITFRYFKKLLELKEGRAKAKELIVAVTDEHKGVLNQIAQIEGYTRFNIPENIGGRFSVITPAGLFPMAFAGINIERILLGASKARVDLSEQDIKKNPAYQYAISRFLLYKHNRIFEIFTTYDPDYLMFSEWWKQLFGESEGKEEKGLFPFSVNYSRDLHSLGQIIQEGRRIFFETTLFNEEDHNLFIKETTDNLDKLNYLTDRSFAQINKEILKAVVDAHSNEGKITNLLISFKKADEQTLGYLWFFFFIAVTISAYLLDVNPFDQPGVEKYKLNMFKNLHEV